MIFNNTKVFPARLYGRKEKTDADRSIPASGIEFRPGCGMY
jgi:S-adenosylmethionine:tRNA-ribosyltransferase-isomerase (queuine synthetase)